MRIERRIERLPLEQRERIKKADELWLQVTLSAGGKPAKDVIRLAKTCSIGVGRLRRIAKRIGVVHVKDGVDGGWIWTLPGHRQWHRQWLGKGQIQSSRVCQRRPYEAWVRVGGWIWRGIPKMVSRVQSLLDPRTLAKTARLKVTHVQKAR